MDNGLVGRFFIFLPLESSPLYVEIGRLLQTVSLIWAKSGVFYLQSVLALKECIIYCL